LRLLVAWVPAGLGIGLVLAAVTALGRVGRGLVAALISYMLLVAAGTVSDAVTAGEPLGGHLAQQPGRAASLAAALVLGVCAALVPGARPLSAQRARGRAAARRRASAASGDR
jgi:hypothetical protein